eukprot:2261510-Pleurochrysis_carterae.AAC.1
MIRASDAPAALSAQARYMRKEWTEYLAAAASPKQSRSQAWSTASRRLLRHGCPRSSSSTGASRRSSP